MPFHASSAIVVGLLGCSPGEWEDRDQGLWQGSSRGVPPMLSHHGRTSLATGFLPPLSFLVFFPGVCASQAVAATLGLAERPQVMSPTSLSQPACTTGSMQASQGTRTGCPQLRCLPEVPTQAVGQWWVPACPRTAPHGVPGNHIPFLGTGRHEARARPFPRSGQG